MNSTDYPNLKPVGGKVQTSGLLKLKDEYNNHNLNLVSLINSNKLITEDILLALQNYDRLYPRFKNVGELYDIAENIRRKLPILKSKEGAIVDLVLDKSNSYTAVAGLGDELYKVTYSVSIADLDPTLSNVITLTPTAGKMGDEEYKLSVRVYSDDSATQQTVAVDSATLVANAAKPIEIFTIEPNKFDVSNNLNVEVTCQLVNATPTTYSGADSFTVSVAQKQKADATTPATYGVVENAKNPNYPSSVGVKKYNVSFTKDDTYTVTFPAETVVNWNDKTPAQVGYKVETDMKTGSTLKVAVDDDKYDLLSAAPSVYKFDDLNLNGSTFNLQYAPQGFRTVKTYQNVTSLTQYPATIMVNQEYWDAASVGNYTTTLTYSVEYTKG